MNKNVALRLNAEKVHFEAICPSGRWLICRRLPVTQTVWSALSLIDFLIFFKAGKKTTHKLNWLWWGCWSEVAACLVSEESEGSRRFSDFLFKVFSRSYRVNLTQSFILWELVESWITASLLATQIHLVQPRLQAGTFGVVHRALSNCTVVVTSSRSEHLLWWRQCFHNSSYL